MGKYFREVSLMAALGLLAFTASSASAEDLITPPHAEILVAGSEHLNATFTGTLGLGQLLVPNLGIEIHCEKASLAEAKITSGLSGEALTQVLFENCKVYEWDGTKLGSHLSVCNISNGGANDHITAKAILLAVKHEGVLYVVAEPDTAEPLKAGQVLAQVKYESGKGCPIPLTQNITGSYGFEITQAHQQKLTLTPGSVTLQKLLGTAMKYGINSATMDGGVAVAQLTGAHAGYTWGSGKEGDFGEVLASPPHGEILVAGSQHLNATFTGSFGLGQLLVPTLSLAIHCAKALLTEGKITSGLKGEALAQILLENCKVFAWDGTKLGGELTCYISNGGAGRHISAKVILLAVKHEGVLYVIAEPDTAEPLKAGELLTTITYESGKGCPIPLNQGVTGSYAFEITQAHQQKLTLTPGGPELQELLGTKLFYWGLNQGTIDGGIGVVELTGAHAGNTWGLI